MFQCHVMQWIKKKQPFQLACVKINTLLYVFAYANFGTTKIRRPVNLSTEYSLTPPYTQGLGGSQMPDQSPWLG
jgi:hypothetical protein